jgi:hypothetical protein
MDCLHSLKEDDRMTYIMLGSTAGQFNSCLLENKLKEFEAAGFVVKEGHKSIHDEDSISVSPRADLRNINS